jgi:holin-like protein
MREAASWVLAFVAIVMFALAGQALARSAGAPVPGPVIGMLLAFVTLALLRRLPVAVERASDLLTRHLSLFFVPAAVGVLDELGTMRRDALAISVALAVSTVVGLAVTGLVFSLLVGRGRAP